MKEMQNKFDYLWGLMEEQVNENKRSLSIGKHTKEDILIMEAELNLLENLMSSTRFAYTSGIIY